MSCLWASENLIATHWLPINLITLRWKQDTRLDGPIDLMQQSTSVKAKIWAVPRWASTYSVLSCTMEGRWDINERKIFSVPARFGGDQAYCGKCAVVQVRRSGCSKVSGPRTEPGRAWFKAEVSEQVGSSQKLAEVYSYSWNNVPWLWTTVLQTTTD